MLLRQFAARDRRPFVWPAVAATLLHPLFWVLLLPKGGAVGFGDVQALEPRSRRRWLVTRRRGLP